MLQQQRHPKKSIGRSQKLDHYELQPRPGTHSCSSSTKSWSLRLATCKPSYLNDLSFLTYLASRTGASIGRLTLPKVKLPVQSWLCIPGQNIGIWKCWFLWREENRSIWRKALGAGTRTNNKLNPHMASTPEIEPGLHWWEASALTSIPSRLPWNQNCQCKLHFGTEAADCRLFFKET